MKTTISAALLFLAGTIVGFLMEPSMIGWLASSTGLRVVSSHVDGGVVSQILFSIGCGLLLGISPILTAWAYLCRSAVATTVSYLFGGCAVFTSLAIYHRWFLGSLPLPELAADHPTLISVDALPTVRLPIAGILSMILAAAPCKAPRSSYSCTQSDDKGEAEQNAGGNGS